MFGFAFVWLQSIIGETVVREFVTQFGPMGLMLLWFMFRVEPAMNRVTAALDRYSRIQGYEIIRSERASPKMKAQIRAILAEMKSGGTPGIVVDEEDDL